MSNEVEFKGQSFYSHNAIAKKNLYKCINVFKRLKILIVRGGVYIIYLSERDYQVYQTNKIEAEKKEAPLEAET